MTIDAVGVADLANLDSLYRRHGSLAYGLALRLTGDVMTAQDAVQSAFMSLWRDRRGRDRELDERGAESVRARLIQLVARAAMDGVRSQSAAIPPQARSLASHATEQPLPMLRSGG